jgi:hypothetical protein
MLLNTNIKKINVIINSEVKSKLMKLSKVKLNRIKLVTSTVKKNFNQNNNFFYLIW